MNGIEELTCVRFVPRTSQENFIEIRSKKACSSSLGMVGGKQYVSLSKPKKSKKGCMARGTIQHELIHTLGYSHMHNHADRDDFVKINWKNIADDHKFNFKRVNERTHSNFGTGYDFYSIMHYDMNAFTKNGKPTMVPLNGTYESVIGQRNNLSSGDATRINNMYKCETDSSSLNRI
jgi:hypothetical protein